MSSFKSYAKYYDLFYKDKNYKEEAEYIHAQLAKYAPEAKNIADFGCGTGIHDFFLAGKGYSVTGIDKSKDMLRVATKRRDLSNHKIKQNVNFVEGDIRKLQLNKQFDAIVSLFHVVSYMASNDDLMSVFSTMFSYLNHNGIALFDAWYGPAVLSDLPVVKIKTYEDARQKVTRISESVINANEDTVDVLYTLIIFDKKTKKSNEVKEMHKMRYLFKPEIEFMIQKSGMKLIGVYDWMKKVLPTMQSRNILFIVKKP